MPIGGRIVSAMKRRWHPDCFKCDACGEGLEHVAFYEEQGKPYCHVDYHEVSRFIHKVEKSRPDAIGTALAALQHKVSSLQNSDRERNLRHFG